MKIGMFTDTFEQPNGVARHVKEISEVMSKENEVVVYTGSGSSDRFKVVNLPHYTFPLQTEYEYLSTWQCKVDDIDVAHAHSPYCTGKLALRQTVPIVSTTHTIPQHMLDYLHLNALSPLAWKYLVRFHNNTDFVVCQTKSTQELFKKHGLKVPSRVISTGIDMKKFGGGNAKEFINKYNIDYDFVFSATRLSHEKRCNWIFKACAELDIPCVACSTGPMEGMYRKKYKNVKFLGRIPYNDIYNGYKAASVFAIASKVETEGIVVNEAMASKTPLIATDLPCISDSIKDNVNGFTFKNYSEFKEKLEKLWGDKQLQKKFASNAYKDVKKKDYSIVSKELLSVYESLV